ncbi:hypothetical protein FACS1894202_06420 [Clostridia bacterium]|nr:hypothetical protein FACS1894202_06420 [Clostridia bacterium]
MSLNPRTNKPLKPPKVYAANLLSARSYSVEGLRRKLDMKGYDEEEIDATVDFFTEMGYLDDEKYALALAARYTRKGFDRWRVTAELRKRGIDRETAADALNALEEENNEDI